MKYSSYNLKLQTVKTLQDINDKCLAIIDPLELTVFCNMFEVNGRSLETIKQGYNMRQTV